jgi:predicted PurR-regulated permease PerM
MDELLVKQLTRQLKLLNFWITVFGTLFLISLIIIGFLLYKVVNFTQNTADRVNNIQDKVTPNLNIKDRLLR